MEMSVLPGPAARPFRAAGQTLVSLLDRNKKVSESCFEWPRSRSLEDEYFCLQRAKGPLRRGANANSNGANANSKSPR
eukprot:5061945-Amphidinium_carterae.1